MPADQVAHAKIGPGLWIGWKISEKGNSRIFGKCCAPRRIRTSDLLIRSQTLYPAELWAPLMNKKIWWLYGQPECNRKGLRDGNRI